MRTILNRILIFSIFMIPAFLVSAEHQDIIEYLKSSKATSERIFEDGALIKISDALWIEAQLIYNLENNSWGGDPISVILYKNDGKITLVNQEKSLIPASPEFLSSISANYKLNNEEDAILFQTMLYQFDQQSFAKGFHKTGNEWYFVRHEMFGDKSGFKVITDESGKIIKIEYVSKFEFDIPETQASGEKSEITEEQILKLIFEKFSDVIKNQVDGKSEKIFSAPAPKVKPSKEDAASIQHILSNNFKEEFKIAALESPKVNAISDANFYTAKLTIYQKLEQNASPTTQRTIVISHKKDLDRAKNPKDLLSNPLFIKSLKDEFNLLEDKWIHAFESALNEIDPGEKEALEIIKKDNIIMFVREKRSEDKLGYLVLHDKNGKIIAVDYNDYSEKSLLKMSLKDPENTADFAFKLVEPTIRTITISEDESIPVKITFDKKIANANSAWLLTQVNGKMSGMEVSSEGIESPFTDDIPGKYLKKGKHLVEYILMPPGNDTEKAFAKIAIEVEVK